MERTFQNGSDTFFDHDISSDPMGPKVRVVVDSPSTDVEVEVVVHEKEGAGSSSAAGPMETQPSEKKGSGRKGKKGYESQPMSAPSAAAASSSPPDDQVDWSVIEGGECGNPLVEADDGVSVESEDGIEPPFGFQPQLPPTPPSVDDPGPDYYMMVKSGTRLHRGSCGFIEKKKNSQTTMKVNLCPGCLSAGVNRGDRMKFDFEHPAFVHKPGGRCEHIQTKRVVELCKQCH